MFDVKVLGVQKTRRSLNQLVQGVDKATDDLIHKAAEKFVEYAQEHVHIDEKRLHDSIEILKDTSTYGLKQIVVGVNLSKPGTRAKKTGTVKDYAEKHEDYLATLEGIGYIDYAHQQTEAWLNAQMRPSVEDEVKKAGFFGTIGGAIKSVFGAIGRMFGR
jgi:galactose-1-phosphate uridylyltransferase